MRVISGLFLVVLVAALAFLSYENSQSTTLEAGNWRGDVPLPLLVVVVYLLGMLSGWWLVGLVKRSWQRVTEPDHRARA
jgi:lipopolysaccharide assembly protein A